MTTANTTILVIDLIGREVTDPSGSEIGTVATVYIDERNGDPAWLAITTGWFGNRASLVPIAGAYLAEDDVVVAAPRDTVMAAPNVDVDVDDSLSGDEEDMVGAHYGISSSPIRRRLRAWRETVDGKMTVPIRRQEWIHNGHAGRLAHRTDPDDETDRSLQPGELFRR